MTLRNSTLKMENFSLFQTNTKMSKFTKTEENKAQKCWMNKALWKRQRMTVDRSYHSIFGPLHKAWM